MIFETGVTPAGRLRTAVVGPHTVGREYDDGLSMYSEDVVARNFLTYISLLVFFAFFVRFLPVFSLFFRIP